MLATATNKRLVQRRLRPLVRDLLAARVVAEDLRPKIDATHAAILAANDFRDADGNRVTDPRQAWTIADEVAAAAYYALCDDANRTAGYTMEPGHCPALYAEAEVVRFENAVLKVAAELIDPAFASIWNMDKRREAIDLLCGLALAK